MAFEAEVEDIKQLTELVRKNHEKLNNTFSEFKGTQEEAAKEFLKKGDLDPLLKAQRDAMTADMLNLQKSIDDALLKINRPRLGIDSYDEKDANRRYAHKFFTDMEIKVKGSDAKEISIDDVDVGAYDTYKRAFVKLCRKADDRKLTAEEFKALSIGSDPDGGYTVFPEMSNRIIERMFESSPMRQVVTVETISSQSLILLEDPNEFSASRTAETSSTGNSGTAQLARREIVAHIMEARPRASQSLIDDSSVDIAAWIARKVANKFGRIEANEFIVGDGVGKARGITTYAAGTTWGSQIEQINSGANGDVTYAGLVAIVTSLKEPYYSNAQWLMHRALIGKVLGLTGTATPLWIPSIAVGQPSTLLGYPVRFAQDFAALGTGSLSGAFGDFRAGYTWVDRLGIRTQVDPYTAKPNVEYYTTKRSGGDVVDFDAIKVIKLSA